MTSPELENLVSTGQLKRTPIDQQEIEGLITSGKARLKDAARKDLALASRFDLAYSASHALAQAALRLRGYRSENRHVVFQVLPHTLGLPTATWRFLAQCHGLRNRAEYDGMLDVDERLVDELILRAGDVRNALERIRSS